MCELYRLIGFYGMGVVFNLNITEIAKFQVGRLRPHFLDTCNIELTPELCIDNKIEGIKIYKYVNPEDYNCTNADDHARIGESILQIKNSPQEGDHKNIS